VREWNEVATTDPEQLAAWFTGSPRNIGIACGPSGLVVIDEDEPGAFNTYADSVGAVIPTTYTVTTGRGSHFYFRAPGLAVGNQVKQHGYAVDVRGVGGYVVGPGSMHATGALYRVVVDEEPAPVPAWLLEALRPASTTTADVEASKLGGLAGVPEVIGAGVRHDTLMRYASSLRGRDYPMDEARLLLHAVWTRCEQPPGDEMLWPEALGILTDVYSRYPPNEPIPTLTMLPALDPAAPRPWQPVDLSTVLNGSWTAPQPLVGRRGDGKGIFYPAKCHTVVSETEGGKTWFALSVALDEMAEGNHVVYIDFEDDEGGIVGRLLTLGAHRDRIRERFHYLRPSDALGNGINLDDLRQVLVEYSPTLAILDGITEAMVLHGLNPLDNQESAAFGKILPRRIADTGCAVASLDHVVKDKEGRGRYALGAVHKLNGLDGASYLLTNRTPFGVGLTGRSTIKIAKDRPGQLRKNALSSSGGTHWYGDLVLHSHGEEFAEVSIEAPIERVGDFRPTVLMTRVSEALAKNGALSQRKVITAVGGNRQSVIDALNFLILDGYVTEQTPHKLVQPYTDEGSRS
jgi:hypothetical protein